MNKFLLFIVFLLSVINLSASSMNHRYSGKSYIHINPHHTSTLTPEQSKELDHLRMAFLKKEKVLNRKIRTLRREMNSCIIHEEDSQKYERLQKEIYSLRAERSLLKYEFKATYAAILED